MSKFGGDMFSKVADAAKAAGQAAMQKAHQAAHYAAEATEQAKRYASEATEHAKRQAQAATAGMRGGSHALALVGQEISVRGRPLRIESLLAEGELGVDRLCGCTTVATAACCPEACIAALRLVPARVHEVL
jgi:hypothetical protein